MAILKRINTKAKTDENTGFGTNRDFYGGRLVNKDGTPNIHKRGSTFFERISWYHTMLALPRWKFILSIFTFFIVTNLVFATIYFLIGTEHLGGVTGSTFFEKFTQTFFFSAQTFTTVGYGHINPQGVMASTVAAFEALIGLLTFAIATGLFYGRFSRPQSFLKFSNHALISPYKEGIALMLRMASFKNNYLTDAEVKVTVAMTIEENGKPTNKFYNLPLELSKVNALSLSWTIVHPINEDSPLYQLSVEEMKAVNMEILVFVKAFDETFSNTVIGRSSYRAEEIIAGAKFIPMYHRSDNGGTTVLELDKLNAFNEVELPFPVTVKSEVKA